MFTTLALARLGLGGLALARLRLGRFRRARRAWRFERFWFGALATI